ncbi:MAG: hypothetical protein NT062_33515 [Proteobacteria bacterium]|nr:hypothetical protein [Pseudomonadota bacterium]
MRIAVATLLVLLGCHPDPQPPHPEHPSAPTPTSAPAETFVGRLLAIQRHMHERFAAAQRIEEAVARGDVERARGEARTIASLEEPDVLPVWQPHFDNVREAARALDAGRDPMTLAHRTAELGGHCGGCHVATHAKLTFATPLTPPVGGHLGPQMVSHQWAALRMWEGLVGPADDRWRIGAEVLANAPLDLVAQAVTPTSSADGDDVARIRMHATSALKLTEPAARVELYGQMLATCAHCHALLRDP